MPSPSKFGPLPAIAGNDPTVSTTYDINNSSVLLTDPFITTNGVTDAGKIYRGGTPANPSGATSVDGLPSNYLLGATAGPSAFDQQIGFDTRFGSIGDIGAFRFTNLALLGTPASISTAGGPTNLALIADNGITDTSNPSNLRTKGVFPSDVPSPTTVISLNGLGDTLLATRTGPITFTNGTVFQNTDGTAPNLTLYARGGALTLSSGGPPQFTVGGTLNLYSDTGVTLNEVSNVGPSTAGTINVVSGGALSIGGNIQATNGDFTATTTTAGGTTVGGDFNLTSSATVVSVSGNANFNSSGAFTADPAATVAANNVTINAGGAVTLTLTSFQAQSFGTGTLSIAGNSADLSPGDATNSNAFQNITVATAGPVVLENGTFTSIALIQTTNADTNANPGNLTLSAGTSAQITQLQLGGDLNLSGDAFLTIPFFGAPSTVAGNVNFSGAPTLQLNSQMTVAGSVLVNDQYNDAPALLLYSGGSTAGSLTVTGGVNLGQGFVYGQAGSSLNVGGDLQVGGSVNIQTLNVAGNSTVGSLSAQTFTTNLLDGSYNGTIYSTAVSGAVTPYTPGGASTFDLGTFTADGGLQFGGSAGDGGSLNAGSLALNVRNDLRFGPSGDPGQSVSTANFNGGSVTASTAVPTAGNGGTLTVANSYFGPGQYPTGQITVGAFPSANPAPSATPLPTPTLTATGGTALAASGVTQISGGAGGTLSFSADTMNVGTGLGSGAVLDASGGAVSDPQYSLSAGAVANGGAGGQLTFNLATTLNLTGGTDPIGPNGPVVLSANGGDVATFVNAQITPGTGGTISVTVGNSFDAENAQILANGGNFRGGTSSPSPGGDGGTITINSGNLITVGSSTVSAVSGAGSGFEGPIGTGGTISLTSTNTANSSAAAIVVSNSTLVVSNDYSTSYYQASSQGGTISLTSARTVSAGISVTNSSQLQALAQSTAAGSGGNITLRTAGANILVDNSTVQASGTDSQVLLTTGTPPPLGSSGLIPAATGPAATGPGGPTITLNTASLSADILRVEALGANGLLTIRGSSVLSATSQLLLYAGNGANSGMIDFVANTTINNGAVAGALSAYTIRIENGVSVTINGPPVQLFGTSLQFTGSGGDNSTTGQFTGSGATVAGSYGTPTNPPPSRTAPATVVASATPKPSAPAAPTVTRRTVAAGQNARPRTLPFEAVQPYLVNGGPELPKHLNAPTSTRKTAATTAAAQAPRQQNQPAQSAVLRPGNALHP